jgi:8-oxo-dGTP pyrophosphatase MutT (NUDIX family)
MQTAAIVTAIRARLEALLQPPTGVYYPFIVDGRALGWVDAARARRLSWFDETLVVGADSVHFADGIDTPSARSEAIDAIARTLSDEGVLSAWRGERYAVVDAFGEAPTFELERCAARYFGIRTFAAHVNGIVDGGRAARLWFGRRSLDKAIDPGLLDNLVGGGIPAGASVAATVIKEAWEEAGIPASLAVRALPAATLTICRAHPLGLERETVFAHDLELPREFSPAGIDGEVIEFRLATVVDAARLIAQSDGPDMVTADASLVVLDWMLRNGAIADPGNRAALGALRTATMAPVRGRFATGKVTRR